MREVAIAGVGMTNFGELWDRSLRDLFVEAALAAMGDAGVDRVDSMYVGTMSSGLFGAQEHIGSLLADYLGVAPIPCTRVESACASGASAVRAAFIEVAAGLSDIVLAGGVEKMTDISPGAVTSALAAAADADGEVFHGITFPGLYAMMARAHMERFGTTREQLAAVAVKNHRNGALNPRAQFRSLITKEDVLASPLVADPLRLLDCSPISDGAAAVIVCSLDAARRLHGTPIIRITGSGMGTDSIALHHRADITDLRAARAAGQAACQMAHRKPEEMHFAEVHDGFTITELCAIEALGFVERGKSGPATEAGETALDGRIPINPSGGLKSVGHPVGASGVAQVCEAVLQLRGRGGERQIPGARIALAHSMAGSGGSSVVHILEAE
jgi:acetyl-CoA C-acetyltransferase